MSQLRRRPQGGAARWCLDTGPPPLISVYPAPRGSLIEHASACRAGELRLDLPKLTRLSDSAFQALRLQPCALFRPYRGGERDKVLGIIDKNLWFQFNQCLRSCPKLTGATVPNKLRDGSSISKLRPEKNNTFTAKNHLSQDSCASRLVFFLSHFSAFRPRSPCFCYHP